KAAGRWHCAKSIGTPDKMQLSGWPGISFIERDFDDPAKACGDSPEGKTGRAFGPAKQRRRVHSSPSKGTNVGAGFACDPLKLPGILDCPGRSLLCAKELRD